MANPNKSKGTAESWLDVPGWQGFYQVSDHGRVRGVHRVVIRTDGQRRTERTKIMAGAVNRSGYSYVRLTRNANSVSRLVHTLVAQAFLGPCPSGLEVCHNDGDPSNNTVENLRYDTHSANMRDMVMQGRNSISKTHCPRNHLLESPNLVRCVVAKGWRDCLSCSRARGYIHINGGDLQQVSDDYYAEVMQGVLRCNKEGLL